MTYFFNTFSYRVKLFFKKPFHCLLIGVRLETACRAPIPYWDSGLDHDMTDPTMSILWSNQFFGNGDGEVMNGPFRDMRTILGTPVIRNYGTGQYLIQKAFK